MENRFEILFGSKLLYDSWSYARAQGMRLSANLIWRVLLHWIRHACFFLFFFSPNHKKFYFTLIRIGLYNNITQTNERFTSLRAAVVHHNVPESELTIIWSKDTGSNDNDSDIRTHMIRNRSSPLCRLASELFTGTFERTGRDLFSILLYVSKVHSRQNLHGLMRLRIQIFSKKLNWF